MIYMFETTIKETPLGFAIEIPLYKGEYEDEIDSYEYIAVSLVFI